MIEYEIGSIRNGTEVLSKEKRPTILFLSDDMRMFSGIGAMSRELILGLCHRFNFIQIGAAIKNPDAGKFLNLSDDVRKRTGVVDASVKILAWNGYGTADLIRQFISAETPSAILHFTDPRFWGWLYDIEHEIRQICPILYYNIWDNTPDPIWNREYYESCDALFAISKQTYGINKRLSSLENGKTWKRKEDWQVKYVPHGINTDIYKPIEVPKEFRNEILKGKEYDFVFYWSNRNIRRKQPADVVWAYNRFCEMVGKDNADRTALVMHTQPVDENGTDLPKVVEAVASGRNIIFSDKRRTIEELNYLYNIADCTINIANNEGFGLTTAESVMAGTPIIVNVTGGLQDQCGFKLDGKYLTVEDYVEIGSLHDWRKWESKLEWGEWVRPVWSRSRSLAGSVPTPYIWDDRVDLEEVAIAMVEMYQLGREELHIRGIGGRTAFINDMGLEHHNMNNMMAEGIEDAIKNFTPRKRWEIFKIR
jgi:glycosyltransferase involved in cell wall biosynthesis